MSKYWDINKILPYQRCFNLINGERSIGKTYTTQKFMINRALNKKEEFVYLVRTQNELKAGVFNKSFSKVAMLEFPHLNLDFKTDICYNRIEDEEGNLIELQVLGYCLALTEVVKIKRTPYPKVKWLLFDEYMLEENSTVRYVNGWKEPDLFLSIYHSIDREEDRVICFLMGNNTSFYNPYHMHPAFNVPFIEKGKIWYSENVLFQWSEASPELKEDKMKCKFLKMIDDTDYGKYAKKGDYVYDNNNFIASRTPWANHVFIIEYMGFTFGIWQDSKRGLIYVDNRFDVSCPLRYVLTMEDHKENTQLTKQKNKGALAWLSKQFKYGNVRFTSMPVKKIAEEAIRLIL